MSDIQGKSNKEISLLRHTKGIYEQYRNFSAVVNNEEFLTDNIKRYLPFVIFAHDLGKVIPSFQIYSLKNRTYKPNFIFPDIPHSIFSLFFLNEDKVMKVLDLNGDYGKLKIIYSVIAFHHWRDSFDTIILGYNKDVREAAGILLSSKDKQDILVKKLKDHFTGYQDFAGYIGCIGFNDNFAQSVCEGLNLSDYLIPPYLNHFLPYRLGLNEDEKKKWLILSGLLIRFDHFTSFIQDEGNDDISIEMEPPKSKDVKKCIRNIISKKQGKIITDDDIWQFTILNEYKESKKQNMVLIAPTGIGKTEFAYLWSSGYKSFYTLPLRSAVNSIYMRSADVYQEKNVSLLHSDADLFLLKHDTETEGENINRLEMSRQMAYPFQVSTGDQVFPAGLKYPGYEKIMSTLAYSRLIIDEVQAYDPVAVAVIIKTIEQTVKAGGEFLLMTATLPGFIEAELQERISENTFEIKNLYLKDENIIPEDFIRHKIQILKTKRKELIDKIISKAKEKKRVLVILNTIKESQKLYEEIKEHEGFIDEIEIELLHSHFSADDRREKEEILFGIRQDKIVKSFNNPKPDTESIGKILIATQIVEASLDIDADFLFTELAPIDSLIQRMGRTLRRVRYTDREYEYELYYKKDEANIIIFFNEENESKDTYLESGKGKVYENELLIDTLIMFFEKSGVKDFDAVKEKLMDRKKKHNDKVAEIFNFFDKKNNIPIEIQDSEKQELVKKVYDMLDEEKGKYLEQFRKTLSLLDSEYVAENKNEAHKIFREIYSIPVLSEDLKNHFIIDTTDFFKKADNIDFIHFKDKIISKYIIHIDSRKYWDDNRFLLKEFNDIENIDGLEGKDKVKVKKWLEGVYFLPFADYNYEKGLIEPAKDKLINKNKKGILI